MKQLTVQFRGIITGISWRENFDKPHGDYICLDRLFEKRGELDGTLMLLSLQKLEESTIKTIESGIMTGDMARIAEPKPESPVVRKSLLMQLPHN